MSISMQQIDTFIDTAINRLSSEQAPIVSMFYIDLRTFQNRITTKLVENCIAMCNARGLIAEKVGDGLAVTVNLNSCLFNPRQADAFNVALAYTRQMYGNHL
jgi:hypothetical protein